MNALWLSLLVALTVFQGWVTSRVLRNGELPPRQRLLQVALIWMIPLVGALVCLVVERHQRMEPEARSRHHDPLHNPGDGGSGDGD